MTPWLAPAAADPLDRPSPIVAPNQTANNNPLKRKGDVDHSRTAGSSRSVCSAQLGRTARWNRRAPRACVTAAIAVNASPSCGGPRRRADDRVAIEILDAHLLEPA